MQNRNRGKSISFVDSDVSSLDCVYVLYTLCMYVCNDVSAIRSSGQKKKIRSDGLSHFVFNLFQSQFNLIVFNNLSCTFLVLSLSTISDHERELYYWNLYFIIFFATSLFRLYKVSCTTLGAAAKIYVMRLKKISLKSCVIVFRGF